MSAFGAAFSAAAFDAGPAAPAAVASGVLGFSAEISVVDPLVFDSAAGHVKWYATVVVGAVNISARLTGQIRITGAEDSARLAELSVVPASAAELSAYDSAPVTVDVTLFRPGQQATYRRFTGRVESVSYDPYSQVATLQCRDGWQERPIACASAAEVEALFGGLATPAAKIVVWNTAEPDPMAYFTALLDTMRGATAIDSSGVWSAIPWTIGTPAASFTAGEVFDASVRLRRPARASVPSAIVATLTHRYPRLHAAELVLSWQAVEAVRYVVDGLPVAPKSMVAAALAGISGWLIKGEPSIVEPVPGTTIVIVGGNDVPYVVSYEIAAVTCDSMTATLYRRWYQMVDVRYSVTIDMGGLSERDASIYASIESTFDGAAWETAPTSEASVGIYQDNAPEPLEGDPELTGYEGLPAPWPPGNGALDHFADLDLTAVTGAAAHVVARALRRAAAGKRQQRISFERPLDPRWEIGAVLAVAAYGLAGTGQLAEFADVLDHDSGEAVSTLTLACPDGSGETTTYSAALTPPAVDVSNLLAMPALSTHVGAALETPDRPDEALLLGFLCNVHPGSDNYAPTKPVYQGQFRIVMPEIPAAVRDPLSLEAAITATVAIAGSGVEVTI